MTTALMRWHLSDPNSILEIHRIKAAGQSRLIQGFNGVPAQAEEGRDLFDWKHRAEPDNALAKATCHPSMAVQPGKALQTRAAVTTGHAAARNRQPSLGIKNRQVTDQADFHVVNTVREHAAPIADHRSLGAGAKENPGFRHIAVPSFNPLDLVAFPATKPRHRIILGQRFLPGSL
jgi:hypothetical protein